ncbi:hypothetical protein [Hyphococcus luteus]|uniref:Uncharacterized protein n=1 Tax=Hyphococcus luteus TaxID=2058213 RepID=A0A2S7K3Z4_9PROT|nr:hypothetical protein [Marinicaulis flavus]PQA87234.1 hypothetical protein CW354_12430 [Marinicaulis flavus]
MRIPFLCFFAFHAAGALGRAHQRAQGARAAIERVFVVAAAREQALGAPVREFENVCAERAHIPPRF